MKPALDFTAEEYSFLMATNLESAFHLSQLAHPLLKASEAGSIVFISSIAGVTGMPNLSIYAATKGNLVWGLFYQAKVISNCAGIPHSLWLCYLLYSSGALNQLTKNLACEWANDNIRVNCVAPGPIRTPLMQPVRALFKLLSAFFLRKKKKMSSIAKNK